MSDFDKAALLTLCDSIQRADRFCVRVNLDGQGYRDVPLAEMPAHLAVYWAMHLVKSRLLGVEITPAPEVSPNAV